ncbi:hypothetical protein FRC12_023692 [Ceratobasidium sp. 428]|nr:hypothetical protein FRC12_023692 [Ceratobasidium sp. 428]
MVPGVMCIIGSISEGFHNVPSLYGSDVRPTGPIDDVGSGFKEGAKGLFYGYYDGITGLVKEPLAGAKKEGFLGFIKGSGRSYVNASMRPAAGIVGMIARPIEGAWKSVQSPWAKKQDSQQLATRVERGQIALGAGTHEERQAVIDTFKRLAGKSAIVERRKTMEAEAREELKTDKSKKLTLSDEKQNDEVEASSHVSTPPRRSSPEPVDPAPVPESKQSNKPPPLPPRSPHQPNQDDEDAAFQRDLDMAMQLSLAEQQGYERGLRHANT